MIEEPSNSQSTAEIVTPDAPENGSASVQEKEQALKPAAGNAADDYGQPVAAPESASNGRGEPQNVADGSQSTSGSKAAERKTADEEKAPEKTVSGNDDGVEPQSNQSDNQSKNGAKTPEKRSADEEQKSLEKTASGNDDRIKPLNIQNNNQPKNTAKGLEKKTTDKEQKAREKAAPEPEEKLATNDKNQSARPEIRRHRVGGDRPAVRIGTPATQEKAGEDKVLHRHGPESGKGGTGFARSVEKSGEKEDPGPSGVVAKVQSTIGSNKYQIARAFEFVDPTEELGSLPSILPLGDQVNEWVRKLTQKGILLLQCADRDVLRSAGHAIAGAEVFSSWRHRALKFGPWKWAQEPDSLHKMLFHDQMTKGGRPTLIIVFGYWRKSEPFLQVLPEDEEIESIESLKRDSLRIVVLVTPDRLRGAGLAVPFGQDYAFPPVDFLSPLLSKEFPEAIAAQLASGLRQQFEHKLWGDNEEEFHRNFIAALGSKKLEAEVERRNQLMTQKDPAAALKRFQVELSNEMLGDAKPHEYAALENTIIFTATYFEDLPADDFQRVLLSLLKERSIEIAVPGPAPTDNAPPIMVTRPKLLRQIWSEERQAILSKCRLRILEGDPPVVGFESADLRDSLKKRFESEFFFLFDELCEQVMETRLFFDVREEISEGVRRLLVRRIKNDPSGYGQNFLYSLVLPLAPGGSAEDQGTMEKLRSVLARLNDDRRRELLNRLGSLLNSLVEAQLFSPVDGILRTLVDFGRHDDVLQLLGGIIHPAFLTRRVEVLKRIVNEGASEMRDKVGRHLLHWVRTGGSRTASLLQALHGWCDNRPIPSARVASQFFVELCAWCILPPMTWESQPMALALAAAETDACFQEIASWVLSLDSSAAKYLDIKHNLGWVLDGEIGGNEELQFIVALILSFIWIMPRSAEQDVALAPLSNGELSQAILLIWFSSYERALMLGLPGRIPPDIYAGTLRATLIADCSLALRSQGNGFQDVDRLAKAVARVERGERMTLLAHWAAMATALGDCLAVPQSSQFAFQTESAAARKKLIERWNAIRNGLTDFRGRVLSAVANMSQ